MTIDDHLEPLGPGVWISYLKREDDDKWWCELTLPAARFTATVVTDWSWSADLALKNAAERAEAFRRDDGREVAA